MSEAAVQAAPRQEPSLPGCPVTDQAGRPCAWAAGHDGAHGVAMEPMEAVYREAVRVLVAHRNQTAGRSRLLSAREVKMDLILDNQVAILNGLAMVLDGQLRGAGLPGEIRILPKGGDGRA